VEAWGVKLLSLVEATACIVEDAALCMRPWIGGTYRAFQYDREQRLIVNVFQQYGGYESRLILDRPDDVFTYWRVDPIEEVRKERDSKAGGAR
jgi:hypothetical protein